MKNIFSRQLYLQGLRKIRTAGVAMSVVILVLNAWVPIQCITRNIGSVEHTTSVEAGIFAPFGFLLMFFAPLLVYSMFSFLNDRRGSDFFHSLPQKRICVYLSFMSAILTWIVSVLCATSIVNTLLWAMADGYILSLKAVLLTLLGFLILALVMAGFMALAMTLTGTSVANCLVFLLFFLFIRACGMFFLFGFSGITEMFDITHSPLRIFDWDFFLPLGLLAQVFNGNAEVFQSVCFFLYWIAVAVVLLVASAVAYCRRRSESATKSAPNRFMQNLYRIGVTFPFLMMGVYLVIVESDLYLFLLCAFVAFLVWVIFELMTTKKIKNVIRSIPLLLIPALMAVGYGASLVMAKNIYYATVPERDDIVSAKYQFSRDGVVAGLDDAILLTLDVTEDAVLDKVAEAIGQTVESRDWDWNERIEHGYIITERITVTLRSGKKVTYNLYANFDLYSVFRSSEAFADKEISIYDGEIEGIYGLMKLTNSQHMDVWEAMKKDIRDLGVSERATYMRLNGHADAFPFVLTIRGRYEGQAFTQRYMLHPDYTPTALELYMQYYSEENDVIDRMQKLKTQIADIDAGDVSYFYLQIQSLAYAKSFSLECQNFQQIKDFLNYLSVDSHLTNYENTENIYQLDINIEYLPDEIARSAASEDDKPTTVGKDPYYDGKYYGYISDHLFLTFSDEDIERFQQIVKYPTQPIAEN